MWFRLGSFRITDCNSYNGIARLTGYYHGYFIDEYGNRIYDIETDDYGENEQKIKINSASGLIADGPGRNAIDVMVHEIHHTMGRNFHWQTDYHLGKWDLSDARTGVGLPVAYEIEDLGWNDLSMQTVISSSGTYDNIILEDYEETGKNIKILAQNAVTYHLENRSGKKFYSKLGNWVMPGNGLLIYSNGYKTVECADHLWNYQTLGLANCSSCTKFGFKFEKRDYNLIKLIPSANGYKDLDLFGICTNDNCFTLPGASGDAGDLYNPNYNTVFSRWSNPVAAFGQNGNPIVIEHKGKNADSSVTLLIKYDVADAYNGTSPSKPLLYKMETVECNGTYGRPKITWLNNSEPDVYLSGSNIMYKIYRGISTSHNIEPANYIHIATYNDYSPYDTASFIDRNGVIVYCGSPGFENYNYYWYKVQVVDTENRFSVLSDYVTTAGAYSIIERYIHNTPVVFSLSQNYPNPFNPSTEIKFSIAFSLFVSLKVYNATGEEVAALINNEFKEIGSYSVRFDGTNLASGVYFYRLEADAFSTVKKMVLIK